MLKTVNLQTHSVLERIGLKLGGGTPMDQLGSCVINATGMLADCSQHTSWASAQQTPVG